MEKLWIAMCEITVEPGDLPSGKTLAFSNVVTWGESSEEVQEKIQSYLAQFKWGLIGCERVKPVEEGGDYGEELADLLRQAEGNTDAILLGRFFSYKPD